MNAMGLPLSKISIGTNHLFRRNSGPYRSQNRTELSLVAESAGATNYAIWNQPSQCCLSIVFLNILVANFYFYFSLPIFEGN
jgi:hypothetical protein